MSAQCLTQYDEVAHLRAQVEELGAHNLGLTRRNQVIRAELDVRARALELLAVLARRLGPVTELEPALGAALPVLASGLQVQRTLALRREGGGYLPVAWTGYPPAEVARIAGSLVELPGLAAQGQLIVTRGDEAAWIDAARVAFGAPAFVAVPIRDGAYALVTARLEERAGFFPRFTGADADALRAIGGVVEAAVDNARAAAFGELRRFVAPAVAESLACGRLDPGHAHREVTILAVDLVGSTRIVDRFDTDLVAAIFDEYLQAMTSLAQAHEGTVGAVAGDGLLLIFGAPDPVEAAEGARRAAAAAFAMRARAPRLARAVDGGLSVRIGINTGRCAVGAFGDDLHRTYTAIGAPVHLAARLESAAEPGEILVGPRTLELLDGFPVRPRGELELKGFASGVPAFALQTP